MMQQLYSVPASLTETENFENKGAVCYAGRVKTKSL